MKAEMVLKLLEAGYTKTDIDLMEETKPAEPETKPAEPEAPAESETKPTAPAEPEAPEANTSEQINNLIQIVSKLQNTVDAMQKSNAEKAESPKPEKLSTRQVLTDFFGEKKKE
jgi:hypothetical protein